MIRDDRFPLIHDYLSTHAPEAAGTITPDTRLLDSGLLDSLGILQLMEFLGNRLGIAVEDDDFQPENFETVASLVAFVAKKQAA